MRRSSRAATSVVIALVLSVAATGFAAGWALRPAGLPQTLPPASPASSVPVNQERFDDMRNVELVPSLATPIDIVAPTAGVVTGSDCAPGQLASGTAPFAIGGQGLLALATDVPLWRDLAFSTRGLDVEALQAELNRLGHDVALSGVFDAATSQAYREAAQAAGVLSPRDVVRLEDVLWLPSPVVEITRCTTQLGAAVVAGEPLAALASELEHVRLEVIPRGTVPGERVVEVDDVRVRIDDRGTIADQQDLAAIASTDAFDLWAATEGSVPFGGRYVLAEPVEVIVVPPTAIVADGQVTCVFDDDRAIPVEVVTSRVGQSLVRAEGEPPRQVTIDPGERTC